MIKYLSFLLKKLMPNLLFGAGLLLITNFAFTINAQSSKIENKHRHHRVYKPVTPYLYSYSALIYDVKQHKIIFSKNANTVMPMASLTKLMTAVVVLESDVSLFKKIAITKDDIDIIRNTYSRLRVGSIFTRQQLLLMALMASENRAASALARTTYANKKQFLYHMNAKAKNLGMTDTVFYDSTGLDQRNVSSAVDLVKLVKLAYKYQTIRTDSTTTGANILVSNYYHHYANTDALVVHHDLPILLSKTGFISESGHHLVLYSLIKGHPVIIILMNSASSRARVIDGLAVKNYLLHYF